MVIYVFGNPLIKEDSLPFQYINRLKQEFPKIIFKMVDPNENFPPKNEKDLVILDTVKGVKTITLINLNDLEEIKTTPISPHDYDLLFHLQLLKKLGKINSARIIGVPQNKTILFDEVSKLIKLISNTEY